MMMFLPVVYRQHKTWKTLVNVYEMFLSYEVTVIQWLTSCHKNHHDAVRDNVMFSSEIMSTLNAIKSCLNQSYDKQNLTFVVISYEMTSGVRSSIYY